MKISKQYAVVAEDKQGQIITIFKDEKKMEEYYAKLTGKIRKTK